MNEPTAAATTSRSDKEILSRDGKRFSKPRLVALELEQMIFSAACLRRPEITISYSGHRKRPSIAGNGVGAGRNAASNKRPLSALSGHPRAFSLNC